MQQSREYLLAALCAVETAEQIESDRLKLQAYASLDVKKYLEDKILMTEHGHWARHRDVAAERWRSMSDPMTAPPGVYPDRITGPINRFIPGFKKIEYQIRGTKVEKFPSYEVLTGMHRYPEQICKLILDDMMEYQYIFPKPTDFDELHKLLYAMACQTSSNVK